jgi:hemolysin activation/secretion protein
VLTCALALAANSAHSAPPDAGQILQEPRAPLSLPPAPPLALSINKPAAGSVAEGGPQIQLTRIRLTGNTAFSTEALQRLLAKDVGRQLTFADLTRLANRVTQHYRAAGYLVARAYLPAQEVRDGVLDIVILEGTLGVVELRNPAGLNPSALAPLRRLPLDAPVQEQALRRTLLALADLPGTAVQSTLRPGAAVGASDLLVDVSKTRTLQGSADIDNYGSFYTGEYRGGTSLYWNNPLDRGDQMSLRLQVSNEHLHYERLAYQLPLGEQATRVGAAVSSMYYRLGKDFRSLDADGTATIASLYVRQPLVRSSVTNWYAQLQLDDKTLHDKVGSTATDSRHLLHNVVLSTNGDWQDAALGRGSNEWAVNLTTGRLQLDADSETQDAASARSAGEFFKLGYQLQRLQALSPRFALALNLGGQLANKNLATAEKFELGGSQGVRAYPEGEASGDQGWLANVELRWQAMPGWQLQAFEDAGSIQTNRRPWTDVSNHNHLSGAGLGLVWAHDRMSLNLTAAWPTNHENPAPQPQRKPRLWAQFAAGF